jgi:hypothetical protein
MSISVARLAVFASLMLSVLNIQAAFVAKDTLPVGGSPVGVGIGDFNRDSFADLVVANQGSENVSLLLGRGDGTFQAAVNYPAGKFPNAIAVGDFDTNGLPDVAVANGGDPGAISVLLGDGTGSLHGAGSYTTVGDPVSLVVADFNGDSRPDLAAAHYIADGTVSILLGRGDGTFDSAVPYGAGPYALFVTAGDFNGDTRADLAVADDTGISILLGNGNGTFQDVDSYPAGEFATSVAVGNFNSDSHLDLAVANSDEPGTISVLLGNGDGSFRAPTPYAVKIYPNFVATVDFSRDSRLDLVVVDEAGVSVLLGNGNGTFGAATSFPAGANPFALALGEFSSDGWLDLAVVNYSTNGTISTFLNTGGPPTIKDALDAPDLVWTTSGTLPWSYQTNLTHDGVDVARSGRIRRGQTSVFQTTVVGPGTLSFWWKVSSDTLDRLQFFMDGAVKSKARRTWQKPTFSIPAGTHVLRWQYKNLAATGRRNNAWVDEVTFIPSPPAPALALTSAPALPPVAIELSLATGQIQLSWPADNSKRYRVLYKDSLSDPEWQILSFEPLVQDGVVTALDAATSRPQRFYRVIEE